MISIAVVTPSYNQGRFIERTIRSVLDQAYPCLEYVVCDGQSCDETASVLARYADRARIIAEPDSGQAQAVNKGIRATSAEVIGWLNSDDVYCPGALMTIAGFFRRNDEVDVVYGDATLIDIDDRIIGRYYTEPWRRERLPRRPFICQPAVFFRRRVVERFGLLDERLHFTLDYEYWLRLAQNGAVFAYLPYTLAQARQHDEAKSRTQGLRVYDELNNVLKRYVERIPDAWILTQTHEVLRQRGRSFGSPLEFAAAVVGVSLRLSIELNGSVSRELLASSARTLFAGAAKTGLGLPVTRPVR